MTEVFERDERAERAAHNQCLFREVNEQVKSLHQSEGLADDFGRRAAVPDWICECANASCMEHVSLSLDEYEGVRSAGNRFAIAPGDAHFFPDVETIVERTSRYWTVEKTGEAKEVAVSLDPRSRR